MRNVFSPNMTPHTLATFQAAKTNNKKKYLKINQQMPEKGHIYNCTKISLVKIYLYTRQKSILAYPDVFDPTLSPSVCMIKLIYPHKGGKRE